MYKNILIPTDGSDAAETAAMEGVGLAKTIGAKVYGLYVIDVSAFAGVSTGATWKGPLEEEGKKALGMIEEMAGKSGVKHGTLLNEGSPHKKIIQAAEKNNIDLIVMGTAGRAALDRFLLGSVTEKVVRTAPCPVTVVHAGDIRETALYKNILIPTDGSDAAETAVKEGVELAKAIDAKVYGLYVINTSAFAGVPTEAVWESMKDLLEEERKKALKAIGAIEKMAGKSGVKYGALLNEGSPHKKIIQAAEKNNIDLIVMGTAGKTGLDRLGSVAEKVVRTAPCSVTIVHG